MKKNLFLAFLVVFLSFYGCKKHEGTPPAKQRLVLIADPYLPIMKQEVEQYMSLYPKVKFEVLGATTREAIVHLLNDSVHSVIIDRQFNEEELQVAKQAAIRFNENLVAKDGIAIIVNKQNPISRLSIESAKRIVTSSIKEWNQIPESRTAGGIDLVLTERNSGMYELIQKKFTTGSKSLEPTAIRNNQQEVVQYVSSHTQSIGFVAASLVINGAENFKVLPVIIKSAEGKEIGCLPGQQEIHDSLYPFQYSLYLYNTESTDADRIGFSAFILSNIGQTIIQKASLVPASMPYRTIQLTAE
jgi:phosphate transport system substrate-binding protein